MIKEIKRQLILYMIKSEYIIHFFLKKRKKYFMIKKILNYDKIKIEYNTRESDDYESKYYY